MLLHKLFWLFRIAERAIETGYLQHYDFQEKGTFLVSFEVNPTLYSNRAQAFLKITGWNEFILFIRYSSVQRLPLLIHICVTHCCQFAVVLLNLHLHFIWMAQNENWSDTKSIFWNFQHLKSNSLAHTFCRGQRLMTVTSKTTSTTLSPFIFYFTLPRVTIVSPAGTDVHHLDMVSILFT